MGKSEFICPNCKENLEEVKDTIHSSVISCNNNRCYVDIILVSFNE